MTALHEEISGLGLRLLLDHSSCLFALVDRAGTLIEWNDSAARALRLTGPANLHDLLETSSRPRFLTLLERTLPDRPGGPVVLHVALGETGLPHSYRCSAAALHDGRLLIFAEPLAPIDPSSAEEYMRVVNDLSVTTRQLQKTRHELQRQQRQLQEVLDRLALLARVDELTGLLNRRSIVERLHEEVDRSRRYHSPLAVMLIDVDEFKKVNDRYGHQIGDVVLRRVADVLRYAIRGTDQLGRYGGEEFLCVLPATVAPAAAELAERLRRRIINERFTVTETVHFHVSISIGIAELDAQHETLELLVAHADSALYRAKDSGRNCWRVWKQ